MIAAPPPPASAEVHLDAALAADVLQRDRRNIVAKAANGQPLTREERAIMATIAKTAAPVPSPAPSAPDPGDDFALAPGYARPAEDYAATYRLSIPTVYRHRKAGAPFDDPAALPAWWVKLHPNRRIPDWIERAAASASRSKPSTASSASAPLIIPAPSDLQTGSSTDGVALTLTHARGIVELEFSRLQAAYSGTDDAVIELRRGAYLRAAEQLRKIEIAARSADAQRDLARAEYAADLAALLSAVAAAVRALPARVARILGHDPTPAQRDHIEAEVENVFRRVREFAGVDSPPDSA